MSTRPRRTKASQKDSSNDMLGLSREEERMLQRAMYDSLRQQNKFKLRSVRKTRFRKKSMMTRSMAVGKLTVTVTENNEQDLGKEVTGKRRMESTTSSTEDMKPDQEVKRGTRYSPMRKGPLSEMLKSLEKKKTQFDAIIKPLDKRKPEDHSTKDSRSSYALKKAPKFILENINLKTDSHLHKVSKKDVKRVRLDSNIHRSPSEVFEKHAISSRRRIGQRTPRRASVAARTIWLSQRSDTSSPNRYQSKVSQTSTNDVDENIPSLKKESTSSKHMVFNKKAISSSQRMSRNILATAAKRVKKAKLKSDEAEQKRRYSSKSRMVKESEGHSSVAIPPELWLDPRGQPVDTQDFINFLIFRDTPYLEPSLKWLHLPPHRRKQRFFKVIESEPGSNFYETVVYTEKKEGGGKDVVVHCIPPKLLDDGNELLSSTSEQSSNLEEHKAKVPVAAASLNSSCHTQAAMEDESPRNAPLSKSLKDGDHNTKVIISKKPSPTFEYRSKHIMQTRNRRK